MYNLLKSIKERKSNWLGNMLKKIGIEQRKKMDGKTNVRAIDDTKEKSSYERN